MSQDGIMRPRNSAVLFKLEATAGVEAVPSPLTDAVKTTVPQINFNPRVTTTDETTGSLDKASPIVTGIDLDFSFDVYIKGSGTAGVAPEWGDLMRACAWSETILATPVPAAAEACAAGGSTTVANLGTTAAAVAQQYRGMPIVFTGTVPGQSVIADYTAAKGATLTDTMSGALVATTSYQVLACVVYGPASNNIPSGTTYIYKDGILYKFVGCRGDVSAKVTANGTGVLSFKMRGTLLAKVDAAMPTNLVYDATKPPAFQNAKMLMNRLAVAATEFSLAGGAELTVPEDPNQPEGVLPAIHMSREITGSVNPLETLVATRDIMADFRAGTARIVHARLGQVAGNRIAFTIPQAIYTNQQPGDRNGLEQVTVPFRADGRDSGAFIAVY